MINEKFYSLLSTASNKLLIFQDVHGRRSFWIEANSARSFLKTGAIV